MPAPVIPLVLLGLGAAGLAYAALAKKPGSLPSAAAMDLAQRVANKGPHGEWVFKPDVADSILRSLSSMTYAYADGSTRETVKVAPDPGGRVVAASNTARAWVDSMNPQMSVLARLSMATTGYPEDKMLHAVPAGHEADYTGPETGFAVLVYAGALGRGERPPGTPPGGGSITPIPPGGDPNPPGPKPGTPAIPGLNVPPGASTEDPQWRAAVHAALEDLIANGQDPDAMERVAAAVEPYGFTDEARRLRARAAELRAKRQTPPSPAPTPVSPVPVVPPSGPTPVIPIIPPIPPSPVPIPPPSLTPQWAVVTTNDPPPTGDLKVFSSTSDANQIGGAEKNGTVAVLVWNADGANKYARIAWSGGSRWPAVTGYAHQAYLKPAAAPAIVPPALPSIPNIPIPSLPGVLPTPVAPSGGVTKARVTTNDPPPMGDLKICTSPGGPQAYDGAGAEKDGIVDVLQWNAGTAAGETWAQIRWNGGSRRAAITGYAKQRYLTPLTSISGIGPQIAIGASVKCDRPAQVVSPGGLRLRDRPSPVANTVNLAPAKAIVCLKQHCPGYKADVRAPGPGGWSLVEYEGIQGWVPSEWLAI